ncbi:hypothetical protein M2302_005841 [Micromonospora sp. A200]|uniref:hypothetical protein n=1 Tax=Micromonospora sp. A200 TaxID=2940568 RepID=UPI0024732029|nr:hypothetical protein [Micromonospora sp. A200]MDH6465639.1 hypothetical protein [Micromonospora sp. A200]
MASATTLERSVAGRVEQIVLQGSTRNRAGKQLLISLQLVVRDRGLLRWRQAHPAVVLRDSDWLVGHPLGYVAGRANGYVYGSYEDGIIDLLDPIDRPGTLAAVGETVQRSVLPWLEETAQPDLMVAAPAITLRVGGSSIIEWLASRARADLIDDLVRSVVDWQPGVRDGVERGRQMARDGQRPSPGRSVPVEAPVRAGAVDGVSELVKVQIRDGEVGRDVREPAGWHPEGAAGLVGQIDGEQRTFDVGHRGRIGEEKVNQLIVVARGVVRVDQILKAQARVVRVANAGCAVVALPGVQGRLQGFPRSVVGEVRTENQRREVVGLR